MDHGFTDKELARIAAKTGLSRPAVLRHIKALGLQLMTASAAIKAIKEARS